MPFTVEHLLVDKVKPVVIREADDAANAIRLMMEGDYSQLPVVDEQEMVVGMITSDSIVRAAHHLRVTTDKLRVSHACVSLPRTYTEEDEIFDLLDGLRDAYAVLVLNRERRIIGIVTNFDTATYFRGRAEDMMLVEDIENSLKDCIRVDLTADEQVDDATLMVDIGDKEHQSSQKKGLNKAINRALEITNTKPSGSQNTAIRKSVDELVETESKSKSFADLSLQQYITLFLDKNRWEKFEHVFQLPKESCQGLFEGVRLTRNDLFHFRTELSADRRDELKYCRDLLNKTQQQIQEILRPSDTSDSEPATLDVIVDDRTRATDSIRLQVQEVFNEEPQLIEKSFSTSSKYSGIAAFLQTLPRDLDNILVTFGEIEDIIEVELPQTAYKHRSWWANDPTDHIQSREWLEVGWRVASVNISQQKVTFARIRDRAQKYIDFFSKLLTALRESGLPMREMSPSGRSFLPMDNIVSEQGNQITFISSSFSRGGRFRVELYIDTGSFMKNDFLFYRLSEMQELIETEISWPLEWESLDSRRASRIAAYHPGAITDSDDKLADLRGWAVQAVRGFYRVFQDILRDKIIQFDSEADKLYPVEA